MRGMIVLGLVAGLTATAFSQSANMPTSTQSAGSQQMSQPSSMPSSGAATMGSRMSQASGIDQQLSALDSQARQAAISGDASFLEEHLAANYIGINPQGEMSTKDEAIARRKSGAIKYTAIDPHDQKVEMVGNTAVLTDLVDMKATLNGKDISGAYRVSRVWVKQNGSWQQILFQSTRVGNMDAAAAATK